MGLEMSNEEIVLKQITKEAVPDDTRVFQLEDGTILFFYDHNDSYRLYINWEGKRVYAKLPSNSIRDVGVQGNAFYFENGRKIYKAVVSKPGDIAVSDMRELSQDEKVLSQALCSRELASSGGIFDRLLSGKYVYRMCDGPRTDGIRVDCESDIKDAQFAGVHRGKAVYLKKGLGPSIRKLSENFLLIEILCILERETQTSSTYTYRSPICCNDSTPFLYFHCGNYVCTVNTDTLDFQSAINMQSSIVAVVGVWNGVLTVQTSYSSYFTVLLPDTHSRGGETCRDSSDMQDEVEEMGIFQYEKTYGVNGKKVAMRKLVKRKEELESAEDKWTEERNTMIRKLSALAKTNEKELGKLVTKLDAENAKLQTVQSDNENLSNSIDELSRQNTELSADIARLQLINAEQNASANKLRLEISELAQEKRRIQKQKVELISKLSHTIAGNSELEESIDRNNRLTEEQKAKWKDTEADQRSIIYELRNEKDAMRLELNDTINALRRKISELDVEKKTSHQLQAEMTRAMEEFRTQKTEHEQEKALLQKTYEELEAQVVITTSEHKEEIQSLHQQVESASKEIERMKHHEEQQNVKIRSAQERISEMQAELDKFDGSLQESLGNEKESGLRIQEQFGEKEKLKQENIQLDLMLHESKIVALQTASCPLKFSLVENLDKPLIVAQLANGTILYFDNAKPFDLYTIIDGVRMSADMKLMEGHTEFTLRGTFGDCVFFTSVSKKIVKFHRVTIANGQIVMEMVNEMKAIEVSLFENQPVYAIEKSKEWNLYQNHEKCTEGPGEIFDISEIDFLSQFERVYHRGTIYLFRENPTAAIDRVNEKVVRVEGPLLEDTSFYAPPHSDCIYILNPELRILLFLNTKNLSVSQLCYELPANSTSHSIVGIHDGVLTMAFDCASDRQLAMTTLP